MRVEVALEVQLVAGLPGVPDRPHRRDVLTHPICRTRPRHRVPTLDVRLDLGSETEHEAAAGQPVHVVRRVGHRHRGPRERQRDRRTQSQPFGVLRRQRQVDERVVRALRDEESVGAAARLDLARGGDDPCRVAVVGHVQLDGHPGIVVRRGLLVAVPASRRRPRRRGGRARCWSRRSRPPLVEEVALRPSRAVVEEVAAHRWSRRSLCDRHRDLRWSRRPASPPLVEEVALRPSRDPSARTLRSAVGWVPCVRGTWWLAVVGYGAVPTALPGRSAA